MGMVAWILAVTCPSPTLEETAEGIMTTECTAFTLAVVDFVTSRDPESKRNRLDVTRETLKQAIVEALEAAAKGKTG